MRRSKRLLSRQSPIRSKSNNDKLPPEILSRIFVLAGELNPDTFPPFAEKEKRTDLANFTLVCRNWRQPAHAEMWRIVYFGYGDNRTDVALDTFLDCYQKRGNVGIEELRLNRDSYAAMTRILKTCGKGVKKLVIGTYELYTPNRYHLPVEALQTEELKDLQSLTLACGTCLIGGSASTKLPFSLVHLDADLLADRLYDFKVLRPLLQPSIRSAVYPFSYMGKLKKHVKKVAAHASHLECLSLEGCHIGEESTFEDSAIQSILSKCTNLRRLTLAFKKFHLVTSLPIQIDTLILIERPGFNHHPDPAILVKIKELVSSEEVTRSLNGLRNFTISYPKLSEMTTGLEELRELCEERKINLGLESES